MLSLFLSVIFFLNLVIQDNKTNEGIPGAQAVCLDHKEGGMADTTGTIRLQVKPGKHRFRISHIGYKSQTINLNLTQDNATVIVLLEPRTIPMPEITVTDSRILNSEAKIINYQSIIRQIPVAEPDVLRALQTLPSVSAASDWGSMPAIRGLSPNYTHIYLGDAPILNPTHVGGLFTGLDYGMIDQAKVYPGVVPVEYGNYGSGMVQLQPRFSKTAETSVELGLISTTFRTLLSPTASWQTSLAVRYFTLDYVSQLVAGAFDYHFYDLFWANRWSPAESLQIVSNIYFSRESLPNSVIASSPTSALYEKIKTLPHYDNLVGTTELAAYAPELVLFQHPHGDGNQPQLGS